MLEGVRSRGVNKPTTKRAKKGNKRRAGCIQQIGIV